MIGILAAMADELVAADYSLENVHYSITGIGKVNAAFQATSFILNKQPTAIINVGCAGALPNTGIHKGDVVVSTGCRYTDVDVTAIGYDLGQVPGCPIIFESDKKLLEAVLKDSVDIPIHTGTIGTGDRFMQKKFIEEVFQYNVKAIDMESAAIAQVCHWLNIPFISIRYISDVVGKDEPKTFTNWLQKASETTIKLALKTVNINTK